MVDLGTKTLETDRLILRKFNLDDVLPMYNNWGSDYETSKALTWDVHSSPDVTKEVISNWISKYDTEFYFNWVIELKDTKEIIGNIEVIKISKRDEMCEVGYCYGSKYWNKGYGTEALKASLNFLLTDVGLRLVEAKHIVENPASGRVMEKAGMIKEATLRERMFNKHTKNVNDIIIYSITKNDLKK